MDQVEEVFWGKLEEMSRHLATDDEEGLDPKEKVLGRPTTVEAKQMNWKREQEEARRAFPRLAKLAAEVLPSHTPHEDDLDIDYSYVNYYLERALRELGVDMRGLPRG